jgi:diaminohydroxyphosphoribosylaminopyrimidine deaminase/5-amino-6-(5-phosphoribosylamino)uracil reductase
LVRAAVSAVHYAIQDPDAHVRGEGHRQLSEAGVAVTSGDGAEDAARLLEGYVKHRRTGLPFVIAKYAASLDGRIASASGDSRWVSGPETLEWAHRVRPTIDAIVVGSNTVVVDDPQLTARPGGTTEGVHQPLRVVVDSRGRTPDDASVLQGPAPTLIATTEMSSELWRERMRGPGTEVSVLPVRDNHVDLAALLEQLGKRGALTVLFEGGGILLGALFDARLVDRVHAVIAPMIIGAADAPSAVAGRGAQRMADAVRLRDVRIARLGDDVLLDGLVVWPDVRGE